MQTIIEILEKIASKLDTNTDFSDTAYECLEEIQEDINIYIDLLKDGDYDCLDELSIHFLPHATFYALANLNGYLDEQLQWQETFEACKKSIIK